MAHETVTVTIRQALLGAQERAARTERTQQVELGDDLFIRVAPGGRKFLLFCLGDENEPEREYALAAAKVMGLEDPQMGWYQGKTLRSLAVVEAGEELPTEPAEREMQAEGPEAEH